jgi:S1-C subfamily serine protease
LRPGDVIVGFDGQPVKSMDAVIVGLRSHLPNDTVELVVVRSGDRLTIRLTLASRGS